MDRRASSRRKPGPGNARVLGGTDALFRLTPLFLGPGLRRDDEE
jgi:hypothetical protein